MEPILVYVGGVELPVRGVEMVEETTDQGNPYPQVYLHVQSETSIKTTRVHMGSVKYDGGAKDLIETLYERGMVPRWFAVGGNGPEGYDG